MHQQQQVHELDCVCLVALDVGIDLKASSSFERTLLWDFAV